MTMKMEIKDNKVIMDTFDCNSGTEEVTLELDKIKYITLSDSSSDHYIDVVPFLPFYIISFRTVDDCRLQEIAQFKDALIKIIQLLETGLFINVLQDKEDYYDPTIIIKLVAKTFKEQQETTKIVHKIREQLNELTYDALKRLEDILDNELEKNNLLINN